MQTPQQFDFIFVLLRRRVGQCVIPPQFGQDQFKYPFTQTVQVTGIDSFTRQTREDKNPDPFAAQDDPRVVLVNDPFLRVKDPAYPAFTAGL